VLAVQRSFDDIGTPLAEVTFCVFDVETTGTSPADAAICEIGAVKVRGGECLGTFSTLVNPGLPIPPQITYLTGITEAMVAPAPPIEAVLPSFAAFAGDAVLVGHNVRFDMGFLRAALERAGYEPPANPVVDTCALARRLVRDEVPNLRLGTLAERLRLPHRPTHRALDDALATVDLLHLLLERAAALGVLGLDDLLELPTIRGHPQVGKLRLTADLPRAAGVYLFRDGAGRVLYVGKATNLRARVRSYFGGDERRKVGALLRETAAVDHVVCANPLEAAVVEVRLIHEHQPRFNRQAKAWRRYAYVKLTLDERFPRLAVVRAPRSGDGCLYLGPLPSTAAARRVVEAIESAAPIRRCTRRPPRVPLAAPCTPAQLGVAACPCAGACGPDDYAAIVDRVVRGLTGEPGLLLDPLLERMWSLAAARRYEEAADARDRAAALVWALARQRRIDALRRSGRLVVDVPGEGGAVLVGGRLVEAWGPSGPDRQTVAWLRSADWSGQPPGPLPREFADELACVDRWLTARAGRARLVRCDGELAWPLPALPHFPTRPDRPPAPAPGFWHQKRARSGHVFGAKTHVGGTEG
jgi:DNA polymerase-3 subunit epsilon